MLKACVTEFRGSWDTHLPLMEFAYNNSYQTSIGMAPYEALYGRKCRTPVCWDEVGERKLVGPKIVLVTCDKVKVRRDILKIADNRRKDLEFEVGDMVFFRISPWKGILRFGKRGKLSPRYIGPYKIVERWHIDWSFHLNSIAFMMFSMFLCSASIYQTIHMY